MISTFIAGVIPECAHRRVCARIAPAADASAVATVIIARTDAGAADHLEREQREFGAADDGYTAVKGLDRGGAVQRKLGAKAVLAILGGAVLIGLAVNLFAAHRQASDRAASTPAPCRPARPLYGAPPAGLSYVPAPTPLRRRTLRALRVDPRADLQLVKRGGTTYGEVVGVATRDPHGFVGHMVREAHGKATKGPRYALIPFADNDVVAVGARGCRAVIVAAATPDDVRVLAAAVFS